MSATKVVLIQKISLIQQSSTSLYNAIIDGKLREFLIVTSINNVLDTRDINIKEIGADESKTTIKKTDPLFQRLVEDIRRKSETPEPKK
ncbi:MAG: hypothetical protein ACW972_02040 [Promethearchaeota archaeon]|jgi:hypothetical protein